jgi:hypothetical protein
MHLPLRLRGES